MYITYVNNKYPCECDIYTDSIEYSDLPKDFPAPVSGEIVLQADDGFVMRTDKAEDYLRQTFEDGTLILTNIPEPEPEPEPPPEPEEPVVPPTPDNNVVTWDALAEAYEEGVNSIDQ